MGFHLRLLAWLLVSCLFAVQFTKLYAADSPTAEASSAIPQYSNEELLTQMLVVDVSERALDKRPALAISFSQDLVINKDMNPFITLTSEGKKVEGSWIMANEPRRLYFTNIQPRTKYRIQIRPGVVAKSDLPLRKPVDITLTTRNIKPAFDFASRGSILPAKLTSGLPIRVVNVPELDIEFLRVQPDKLPQVLKRMRLGGQLAQWQLEEIHQVTKSVYSNRYQTGAKTNVRTSMVLPVESIPELQEPGLYFVVMREPGRFSDNAYRITRFVVTNLGLHVRLYPRGLEVFAQALDSGKPISGVSITLQGEKDSHTLETNENGHARFAHRQPGDLLLMASQGEQFTFLDLREPALDLSEFEVSGRPDEPIAPFIYSSRDLYRPGENIDLSILLRDRDGRSLPNKNLHLRVVRPDTRPLLEENLDEDASNLGFFKYRLAIPADAPTGNWKAEVRMNAEAASPLAVFPFHVEDFMPERMQLNLRSEAALLTRNEDLIVAVSGEYFYGAPTSNNKLSVARNLSLNKHPLPAFKDYFFGDPSDSKLLGREALPEMTLNEAGSGFIKMPALTTSGNSPLNVKIIANLHETGGRTVTRSLDVPFWPAKKLVGIRPHFANDTAAQNSTAEFDLMRVDAVGGTAQLEQELAVTLVREEKEYFWEYNNAEGWQRKSIGGEYPLLQQKILLDDKAQAKVAFEVQQGYYRLEVEDPETGLRTVYPFHAGWDWHAEENTSSRPDKIVLALDKPAYAAGDTAKLTITPPAAGHAIVAVEGESMLWSQQLELPAEGTTIDIPVEAAWIRHDLYISVTAFRPASKAKEIAPNRALGVIFLPLERADRRLQLSIDAADKVLPEQNTKVTVRAANLAAGERALVTLAAVDAGVLSITDFKTPDPFAYYFSRHKYGVNLHDAYGKIIESTDGKVLGQRVGGDAAPARRGGAHARPEINIVSLFTGVIEFDSEGKAELELPLPAFDGKLRLMAVAVSEHKMGSAEHAMQVASPVVASLAAPRFLAAGDSSFISIDLNNTTSKEQVVQLDVHANSVLDFSPVEQELVLPAGKRATLTLPVKTKQDFGVGDVQLRLQGKSFTSQRRLQFAVRPAWPARYISQQWELKSGDTLDLNAASIQGFLPSGLQATLNIASTPPLPLRSALNGLLQYPYGCAEQTVSGAWPYLFLETDVAEALGLPPVDIEQRREKVNAAILRLTGMQLANGSFTLWGGYGREEYWLTPYIVDFLLDAKEQSFTVPEWMLERALQNLADRLQDSERFASSRYAASEEPAHTDFAVRAYAAYVLARERRVKLGTLRTLYDSHAAHARSGLPLVHLGIALHKMGENKKRRSEEAIRKGLELVRDGDAYLGDYGSVLRDQAAMLYVLLRHKMSIPEQLTAFKSLADLLHNRSYFSTQEQLFTFLAGMRIQKKSASKWQAMMKTGTDNLELTGKGMHYSALSAQEFQKGVSITATGQESLFLALNLDGYPDAAPEVDDKLISVQRQWFDLAGHELQVQDIKAGDLLLTHLVVSSQSAINDALLVDLLPAGFEIENTNLFNNESLQGLKLDGTDKPVIELLNSTELRTQEFRDDRYVAALALRAKARHHLFYLVRVVSRGDFTVPAPYVEDMYRPELHGIGATPGVISISK